jgi:phosphatidylserine/phosphatidylglycerophosphate/cardiolipin synthase-like enzyme
LISFEHHSGSVESLLINIFAAILEAALRGVQVRVAITTPSGSFDDTDLFSLMDSSPNIQASFVNMSNFFDGGIIHTKFIIVDNSTFYVGSANIGRFVIVSFSCLLMQWR